MVAALYSNPNWDDSANDRQDRIKELNKHFNHTIELIYDPDLDEGDEPDWDNPFWQAHLRAIGKTRARLGLDGADKTVQEAIDADEEQSRKLQDLERRARLRDGLDQVNGKYN